MITDRIRRHEVLLPINHNFNKICDILGSFLNQNTRNSEIFLLAVKKKKPYKRARDGACCPITNYLGMMRTVLFNCPIKAEIRAVDSQSDLRILL